MSNQEAQNDEITAMASIYEEDVFESSSDNERVTGGRFSAHLDLPQPFYVVFKTELGEATEHDLKYLPPINLFFELSELYPEKKPPSFTLSCKWLTLNQLTDLCKRLDEIWEENKGEVVLFLWTSFLKDEALDFLEIHSPVDMSLIVTRHHVLKSLSDNKVISSPQKDDHTGHDSRAVQDIAMQELLLPTLLDHNKCQIESQFNNQLFTCQVCFNDRLGSACIQFPSCGHTYCRECMKGYFEVQISEGNVCALNCPYDKCESQALPSQVKELVNAELFARYDRLLLQLSLDTMSDIMFCPRKMCGCAVMVDLKSNMGSCPSCQYVFCIFCKLVFHGVSPCKIQADDIIKLRERYEQADAASKKKMEQRYGKKAIQQIVEESYSLDWISTNSKQCPHCNTPIQKIDGCNKMMCTKCRAFFCWICGGTLSRNNPYSHFSSPVSGCFNRLFEGVIENEDGPDWAPEWL